MIDPPSIGEVTPSVFIGGAGLVQHCAWLRAAGITHILKLYFDEPEWPDDFTVLDLPMDDGVFIEADTLRQGVDFIHVAVGARRRVLVVCGLGISRSATFVLAYLLEQGYDLHEAFHLLHTARPQAWPMRRLWESLIVHYQAPYTLEEIERWLSEKDVMVASCDNAHPRAQISLNIFEHE